MMTRCLTPSVPAYKAYGAKGVTVCDRWRTFKNFYADMGERPDGTSLDRIDNTRGYEPGNCRWATRVEQQSNRAATAKLTYRGETKPVAEWARLFGLANKTVYMRLRYGWDAERALNTPVKRGASVG